MTGLRRRFFFALFAMTAVAVMAGRAAAHPHSWIDVRSTVLFDGNGSVRALHIDWIFDEFYSTFVLQDIARAGEDVGAALDVLTEENLRGLSDFGYFTQIRAGGAEIGTAMATDGKMSVYRDRLRMSFTLPLASTIDPRTTDFEYAVYDPTYYIEILHAKRSAVTLAGPGAESCSAALTAPTPDPASISLAASLDQTAVAPDNLGQLFAEIITISCR